MHRWNNSTISCLGPPFLDDENPAFTVIKESFHKKISFVKAEKKNSHMVEALSFYVRSEQDVMVRLLKLNLRVKATAPDNSKGFKDVKSSFIYE